MPERVFCKLRFVFHAAELKPALFADKKYSQGCQISKQKSVLHAYCMYIVLDGASLQRLRCFDLERQLYMFTFFAGKKLKKHFFYAFLLGPGLRLAES